MVLVSDMYLVLSPDPCDTGKRTGVYQINDDDTPAITVIPEVSIGTALDVLWHDKKHATDMKKILIALISFSIFVAAMFLHIPTTNMYHQSHGMSSALATSGSDTITDNSPVKFYNIETIPDIFDWLNNTFIPQVFVTEDYNGNALPEAQWGHVATFNKVLGAVHFEVSNMYKGKCDTPDFLADLYPNCYDSSSTTTDEFLISFDTNISDAVALLTDKKDSGTWIDSSTEKLLITVITLNGELPGYAVTKLQLDFNDGGYIEPSASTTSTLLDQYPSTTTIVLDVLVVLWFSPWILVPAVIAFVKTYEKKHRLTNPRQWMKLAKRTAKAIGVWAFPDGWFAIDFFRGPIVNLFYITVLITQAVSTDSDFRRKLLTLGHSGQSGDEASDNLASVTRSFRTIANLTVLLRLLATAAVLVLGLRILNTFRDHVGLSILTRTMASAVHSFWTFSVVFAVIFTAFAASGTVLFGSRIEDFSSLASAMKSCVNMIYGDFDFDTIKDIDYSVVYYWSYMTLQTFVLLNIVLAIVVDAYQEEKIKKDKNKCWVFRRVVCNVFRQWLARVNDLLWFPCCPETKVEPSAETPTGSIPDDSAYSLTEKKRGQWPQSDLDNSEVRQLTERLENLERKLDYLIENLAKQAMK
ncbi:hypothetical protein BBO99_00000831 [Phytophthora kernoviae]|uniref:Polycystin cation channel PKD1/PKD2 domain-containing protein n=2 Tax=Phytophthora kernoviae TaxID=325452 RepID=A0A3R7H4W9_9STRA|nr:hypothetical protein G195_001576 [Phytophthora kernoviae 00238/432]KAG2531843.1 hypothetical protein JM16_000656 [Phytophthora kernoviae]KAG2532729.1 hypothetical protein JM18_000738 [Phytophthora kernoviae]RLN44429.1 hypothetical protein BBI17_000989 [Phytophthora kernoviae]RLN85068.1 hypothetical protein BBO99_00000831 [Phytophthora kernoviae]